MLVIVAIALGVLLLARGFDGSNDGDGDNASVASTGTESDGEGSESNGDAGGVDDGETDPASPTSSTTTTTTTVPPPITHRPGEVKVAAINGKGAPGLASAVADALNALGFTTKAKNAVNFGMEMSVIYYQPDYADDAKAIAVALNAPADTLRLTPSNVLTLIRDPDDVSDFNIFVLLAEDDLIPVSV